MFPLSTLCFATTLNGCSQFTWPNHVTVGSRFAGQMLIKIQTRNFVPELFSICTNQLHLPKKTAAKGWNRYQRRALRKWNTDFRLEHSNGKNRGKLRDGRFTVWANVNQNSDLKFCPGIVFAICTNQLHLPKKHGRERLKPVSKTGFEEMEHGFPFRTF